MDHIFDDASCWDVPGVPEKQIRRAHGALVAWMVGCGWLQVGQPVAEAYRRFADGKLDADQVYASMGHRLTADDVVPDHLDAVFDRFGEFFAEGEAWEVVEGLYGESLAELQADFDALQPLYARLDRLCGVGPVDGPVPDVRPTIPVLAQLGTPGKPLRPWELIEVLEGIGYGLAMAAHQQARGESPWVGVDREDGAYLHCIYGRREAKGGRIRVEPRPSGGCRAWTTGLPSISVSAMDGRMEVEVDRLSQQDRDECGKHLRSGAAAFAARPEVD